MDRRGGWAAFRVFYSGDNGNGCLWMRWHWALFTRQLFQAAVFSSPPCLPLSLLSHSFFFPRHARWIMQGSRGPGVFSVPLHRQSESEPQRELQPGTKRLTRADQVAAVLPLIYLFSCKQPDCSPASSPLLCTYPTSLSPHTAVSSPPLKCAQVAFSPEQKQRIVQNMRRLSPSRINTG